MPKPDMSVIAFGRIHQYSDQRADHVALLWKMAPGMGMDGVFNC